MSSSSTESGTSPPATIDDDLVKKAKPSRKSSDSAPLIIAAYRYGDPYHKRRVKVPCHITWNGFLTLLSSRLEVERGHEISTYDENGIEIVSVEDLVPNDVLVVKERSVTDYSRSPGAHPRGSKSDDRSHTGLLPRQHQQQQQQHDDQPQQQTMSHSAVAMATNRHLQAPPPPLMGTPLLTHFIKANHFGYYFLAEVEGQKVLVAGRDEGVRRRVHCVVKVPTCDKSSGMYVYTYVGTHMHIHFSLSLSLSIPSRSLMAYTVLSNQ